MARSREFPVRLKERSSEKGDLLGYSNSPFSQNLTLEKRNTRGQHKSIEYARATWVTRTLTPKWLNFSQNGVVWCTCWFKAKAQVAQEIWKSARPGWDRPKWLCCSHKSQTPARKRQVGKLKKVINPCNLRQILPHYLFGYGFLSYNLCPRMFRMVQKVIYLRSLLNLSAANSDLSLAHIE